MIRQRTMAVALFCSAVSLSACAGNYLGDLTLERLDLVLPGDPPVDEFMEVGMQGRPVDGWRQRFLRAHVSSSSNLLETAGRGAEVRKSLCSQNISLGSSDVYWRGQMLSTRPPLHEIEPEEDGRYHFYFYIIGRYTLDQSREIVIQDTEFLDMSEHPVDICARIISPTMLPPLPSTNEIRIPAARIAAVLGAPAPP